MGATSQVKKRYLVSYDNVKFGGWFWVWARSKEEIESRFEETFKVMEKYPKEYMATAKMDKKGDPILVELDIDALPEYMNDYLRG